MLVAHFEDNKQTLLHATSLNMWIYGTTVEKGVWDARRNDPDVLIRDPFNIFPCSGYTMCDTDIPYLCDVDFLDEYEIRSKFGIPDNIEIPAYADEQLAGTIRETVVGGRQDLESGRHYPTNYATVQESTLSEALKNRCLAVIGDPGAGKTTFLRGIANRLSWALLAEGPPDLTCRPFPVFLRVDDLSKNMARCLGKDGAPVGDAAPNWIAHCAAQECTDSSVALDQKYFIDALEEGQATVLLDGLDEAPTAQERERIV